MTIIYYVTNHGYGHGVRTSAIVNALPESIGIVFRTTLPEAFFRAEVRRDFTYAPAAFDCGCIQHDSLRSDIAATLAAYRDIAKRNERALESEAAWCRQHNPALIVSDIVPFAFDVAAACGIPSAAVANFTWLDIYEPYCREYPAYRPLLATLKRQYASAGLLLSLEPALPMGYFPKRTAIAPVGRQGRARRSEIMQHYGIDPARHLGLMYLGDPGIEGFDGSRLGQFAEWEFLGVSPIRDAPANYHCIEKAEFPYQDLSASVDCMVGKLGYGAVVEAMLHGTPMIYLPRDDFMEFRALDSAVRQWGGGECLTAEKFAGCDWADALDRALARPRPRELKSDGARRAAACIAELAGMVSRQT
jgi:hypothetical protein